MFTKKKIRLCNILQPLYFIFIINEAIILTQPQYDHHNTLLIQYLYSSRDSGSINHPENL